MRRRSDEMSLDIILALFAGVAAGVAVMALVGSFCYVSGIAFGAQALWLGLIGGGFSTVATLRWLERSAEAKSNSSKIQ
jgi:hypothetical protein